MARRLILAPLAAGFLAAASASAAPPITWVDDAGGAWSVPDRLPARWVVLGPHLVDMVRAIGAQARIVGVQDDHPVAGAHVRSRSGFVVIGQSAQLNRERLQAVRPDLVVYWPSGLNGHEQQRLRQAGLPLLAIDPRRLQELPDRLRWLGWLAGRSAEASALADRESARLRQLTQRAKPGRRLRAFYQVWQTPLFTLSPRHLVSQGMTLCGADSIVPDTSVAAPVMSLEAVVKAAPEVILLPATQAASGRRFWRRFSAVPAVRDGAVLSVDDEALTRPGLSLLRALPVLCDQLAAWRTDR